MNSVFHYMSCHQVEPVTSFLDNIRINKKKKSLTLTIKSNYSKIFNNTNSQRKLWCCVIFWIFAQYRCSPKCWSFWDPYFLHNSSHILVLQASAMVTGDFLYEKAGVSETSALRPTSPTSTFNIYKSLKLKKNI